MSEHARPRRRSSPRRPGEEPEPAPQQALLSLQQTAGNRAVQRLVYTQKTRTLRVPQSYADRRIPYGNGHLEDRAATDDDPTFLELVNANQGRLRPYVASGIDVKGVDAVAAVPEAEIGPGAGGLATGANKAATAAELQRIGPAADEVLVYPGAPHRYYDPTDIDAHKVLQAPDFFPEAPDLPAAGFPVRQQLPKQMKGQLLWNLTCVLIALVKSDGHGPVQRIANRTTTTLDEAVQALHDHYKTQGVEYDDTSSRFTVMNQWGYRPIFSGRVPWADLPTRVALAPGSYIFDIVGHTVKVDVLQNIPLGGPPIADLAQYFTCHSEKDNYRTSEFLKDVTYIWAK